jgi:acyl-CoA reductase-like NAD-dependent aldehyde dehydrogenase
MRIPVSKTYKLFINGQFPRSESGRHFDLAGKKGKVIANLCQASRKDFREAVVAARSAFAGWSERSASNRGQILYRIGEMLEGRKPQFVEELILQGHSKKNADAEVQQAVDRLIYYAGWCDKYQQLFSSVNPVASPHYNFSVPEPTGVVSIVASNTLGLLGLISIVTPVIAGGNTCVVLASEQFPLCAITFAEVLATSDLPPGVINILTGKEEELVEHFASHMDVNALIYGGQHNSLATKAAALSSGNVKRFFHWSDNWSRNASQGPYYILDLQEIKTTWHPIEKIGGAGLKSY